MYHCLGLENRFASHHDLLGGVCSSELRCFRTMIDSACKWRHAMLTSAAFSTELHSMSDRVVSHRMSWRVCECACMLRQSPTPSLTPFQRLPCASIISLTNRITGNTLQSWCASLFCNWLQPRFHFIHSILELL
jgi:hypothetical protein